MPTATHIRLPNWLGDVVMALPVVRAIAAQHPDTTLSGLASFGTLLTELGIHLPFRDLPAKNWRYYPSFLHQRGKYARTILLANSQRADLEAWLAGIPERYGIAWRERPRRLLNHRYLITHPEADNHRHQTHLWADFTAHFALQSGIDVSPIAPTKNRNNHIILICGSENSPEKRWNIEHWRTLIHDLLAKTDAQIHLCGTAKDSAITKQVAQGFETERVTDLAGKTDLPNYVATLRSARLVIGNDTGGLHLANAVGTPTIGLYGPTNPERTRPIFDAPLAILQPPNCPKHGGANIADLLPDTVTQAALNMLKP